MGDDAGRYYDMISKSYDSLYGGEQRDKYRFIMERGYRPYGLVLDLGCGTGLFIEYIVSRGYTPRIVCIDPSYEMLQVLRRKLGGRAFIIAIQGYGECIPLKDRVADTLYSFTVVNNAENIRLFLNEVRRVVNDKGFAIVSVLRRDRMFSMIEREILRRLRGAAMIGCNEKDCFYAYQPRG